MGVIDISKDPGKKDLVRVPINNMFWDSTTKLAPGMTVTFADPEGQFLEGTFLRKIQIGNQGKRLKLFSKIYAKKVNC